MSNGASTEELESQRELRRQQMAELQRQKEMEKYPTAQQEEMGLPLNPPLEKGGYGGVDEAEKEKMGARDYSKTVKEAKQTAKEIEKGKITGGAKEMAVSGMQLATGKALQASWLNLIDSFGLTFIYIIIHFFCRYSHISEDLSNMFCPFGSEWSGGGKMAAAAESVGKGAELIEIAIFLFICLLLLFIILIIVLFIVLIVSIASMSTWEQAKLLWGEGFEVLFDFLKG